MDKFLKNRFFYTSLLAIFFWACGGQQQGEKEQAEEADEISLADESIEEKAQRLAHKYIITDGHVDLPYRLHRKWDDVSVRVSTGDFDYERAKEGGLDAPFMSIYVPADYQKGGAKEFAEKMIGIVHRLVKEHPEKFALANSPEEVKANFENGLISFPMGMENGAPIESKLENVDYFYEQGIRYITLTHGKDNHICDSSYDNTRTWKGLSPFGKKVITKMNETGIMIDVSHISDDAFYQVMDLTAVPVIASHSSCRKFTPGWERNMNDDMIKALAENGGVIQINFGSSFISEASQKSFDKVRKHFRSWLEDNNLEYSDPKAQEYLKSYGKEHAKFATVADVADHIDHVVALVGIDHVGLGSDYDGVGDTLPEGLKDVSDFPNLIAELLRRDYSEEDIEKICYKNQFRVWQAVLDYAKEKQKA